MDYSLEKFNWKFVAFFIAVSAVLFTGIYFLFPNQLKKDNVSSKGWKAYAYEKYEFQYPENWNIWMTFYSAVPDGCFAQGDSNCVNLDGLAFSVNILPWDENTCKEYWNGVGGPKAVLRETRMLDGRQFYYGRFQEDNLEIYHTFFNGSCYELARTISGGADLNKIITTFRFTKKDSDCDESCVKSFSPDKKYTVFDRGTSPIRSLEIVDTKTQKRIVTFHSSSNYTWLSDEFVFEEPVEFQDATMVRPWQGAEGLSISKIILSTGKKVVLLKSDNTHDYYLARNSEGSIIKESDGLRIDIHAYAPTGGDERFWNPSVQHWIMDSSGKLIKNIDN